MTRAKHLATLTISALALTTFGTFARADETPIDQVGQKFSQSTVSIKVGDTVAFHNQDDVTHNINVTSPSGSPEDQGLQKPGETISKKFDAPGKYEIRCAIHPRMKMSVEVK